MLAILLTSLSFGVLNALRGSGFWDRPPPDKTPFWAQVVFSRESWMAAMVSASLIFTGAEIADWERIAYWLLMWFGFMWGWGLYLNVAFPNLLYINESEVLVVDWLATKLYKKPRTPQEFSNWCFIAFFFRSMFLYPVFVLLFFKHPHALCWGIGVLSMPIVYWIRRYTPEIYAVRIAEFTFGSILGALIAATLTNY